MKDRYTTRRVILNMVGIVLGVGIALLLLYKGGRWLETRNAKLESRGNHLRRYAYGDTIEMGGATYRKKSGVSTILLMGVDRESDISTNGNRNGGQADFLRLVVVDSEAETVSQVQIDRDTMTPITILGVLGNRSGVRTAQICLAHSFGDGGAQSCELMAEAVSNLLLGSQIDYYIAMSLDGISALNDWAGGVTVTLTDDFSALDAAMTPGTTLTLNGDQAEIFVRSRRSVGIGTNEARMERQQEYISLLSANLDHRLDESKEAIGDLYDTLEPYLTTNVSRGRLINLFWEARLYGRLPAMKPEGNYELGLDGFMEFHVNEDKLTALVLELLYTQVK